MEGKKGMLELLSCPIGNDSDMTPRGRKALEEADLIAAEDTRRLFSLCSRLGIRPKGRVTSYYGQVEKAKAAKIVGEALAGKTVVLVSDAGTPAINDPGRVLVDAAIREGVRVTALPGCNAALTALVLSGFRSDKFCYEGFIPRKAGDREREFERIAREERTSIFYESPRRLEESLKCMEKVLGPERRVCIARELTKEHEEVLRMGVGRAAALAGAGKIMGEIVVVVEGKKQEKADAGAFAPEALKMAEGGMGLKEAVRKISKREGLSSRDLYRQCCKLDKRS